MRQKVIIESTLKNRALDDLLPFLEANLPNVRGFIGCLNVTVFLDKETGKIIFDEEWLSVEHHQEYINTITRSGVMDELLSFLESTPDIKYFECLDM